ncbi:hypothetical protein COE50_06410 [Bacillus anthracis]|nr:hypothetical protein COE50_06410 [Bacillus anthracis]
MTILGFSKDGQMVKAITPIHHTVIVGSVKKGITCGYVPLNILLETKHNLFVIDWYGELERIYSYKKRQGYQVYIYDLKQRNTFQRFKSDLGSKKDKRRVIFVQGGDNVLDQQINALLVELRKVSWREGLHIILNDYGTYQIPEITSMFSLWRSHKIGISLVLQNLLSINSERELSCILNNSHFLLGQGEHSERVCEWLVKHIKGEKIINSKQMLYKISSLEKNRALLISFVERIDKESNYKFVKMPYTNEMLNKYRKPGIYAI